MLLDRIWDTRSGAFVSFAALVQALRSRRYVLLGEKHDNPQHHLLQARVLEGLLSAGRRPAVAWEMITVDEGDALLGHRRRHPKDAAGLGPALRWEKRGWPSWKLYQPIAQIALEAGLELVPAGTSRAHLMRLARSHKRGPDAASKCRSLAVQLPPEAQASLARSLQSAHCGHASEGVVQMMVVAQQARDSFMAEQLVRFGRNQGAVLIAGHGHARHDLGVPYFLQRAHDVSPTRIGSVSFAEVRAGHTDPAQYDSRELGQPAFDYLWFTERVDSANPCRKYEEQLRRIPKHHPPLTLHPMKPQADGTTCSHRFDAHCGEAWSAGTANPANQTHGKTEFGYRRFA